MTTVGWYGKLPALGDFANRRLPQAFIAPWDAWLQQVVAASQTLLAEKWLDSYLTSHIWRFVLDDNCLCPGIWTGILVPSVDRVGRYFPLCIAAETSTTTIPPAWFEALDESARQALLCTEVEIFDHDLLARCPPPDSSDCTIILAPQAAQPPGQSVWFTGPSPDTARSIRTTGMPDATTYARMLQLA